MRPTRGAWAVRGLTMDALPAPEPRTDITKSMSLLEQDPNGVWSAEHLAGTACAPLHVLLIDHESIYGEIEAHLSGSKGKT